MGKVAFIFPGQGSQEVGMASSFLHNEDVMNYFNKADGFLGFSLSDLCFKGPIEKLTITSNTQPALLTVSVGMYNLLGNKGITPDYVLGHSLGEYSALVAAKSLSFLDALKAVHNRGLYMEEAVPKGLGAMSAVLGMGIEEVREICCKLSNESGIVEVANYNTKDQIVISGHKEALIKAKHVFLEKGAKKVIPLTVSGPFHSSLMKPCSKRLKLVLDNIEIKDAKTTLISNAHAIPITSGEDIYESLLEQIYSPVLWYDSILQLLSSNVDTFVEIGPGRVLSSLVKKIDRKANVISIRDEQTLNEAIDKLSELRCVRD